MNNETVADVLEKLDRRGRPVPLLYHVRGDLPADALDYEDWVRPMKITDGRVCIKFEHTGLPAPSWATWRPDGLHYRVSEGTEYVSDTASYYVKHNLPDARMKVIPVLREDTPFREVNHD